MSVSSLSIEISLLKDHSDQNPKGYTVKWADLADELRNGTVSPCTRADGPNKCVGKKCAHKSNLPATVAAGHSVWMPTAMDGKGRKEENVLFVTVLVLDIDHVASDVMDNALSRIAADQIAYVCHSTHNHNPDNDCAYRLVLALSRPAKPEEFSILRAQVVQKYNLPNDETTRNVNRIFYFPSSRVDVAPFFEESGYGTDNTDPGVALDVDAILASAPKTPVQKTSPVQIVVDEPEPVATNLQDIGKSILAFARSRQDDVKAAILRRAATGKALAIPGKQIDRVDPDGVPHGRDSAIGSLTWSIPWIPGVRDLAEEVLCLFLAPCFKAMADDEFDAAHWENEFLRRLAKSYESFPERKAEIDAKLAAKDADNEAMRAALDKIVAKKNPASVVIEAPTDNVATTDRFSRDDIMSSLLKHEKTGKVLDETVNFVSILLQSEETGTIRFNEITKKIDVIGGRFAGLNLERLSTAVGMWLCTSWGVTKISYANVERALVEVAHLNSYNPLQDYLNGLVWDGVPRIDRALIDLANVKTTNDQDEDITEYVQTISRKWFVSVVARALKPGCQVDTMLILKGEEGTKKTTFFRVIGGNYFGTTNVKMGDKDSKLSASSAWVVEYGELSGLRRSNNEEAKSHLSETEDFFRAPYARTVEKTPRTCVFVGTTNDNDVLPNDRKNRRFWLVDVMSEIDAQKVRAERDQLLAEAVHVYRASTDAEGNPIEENCPWWLSKSEQVISTQAASSNTVESVIQARFLQRWATGARADTLPSLTALEMIKDDKGLPPGYTEMSALKELARVLEALGFDKKRSVIAGCKVTCFHASPAMMNLSSDEITAAVGKSKMPTFGPTVNAPTPAR